MKAKINNIQVLRGLAALSVVAFHTGFSLFGHPTGGFGVDIFFVISGFVMAMMCDTNEANFFRRRIIRIVPAYWACTFANFLLAVVHPDLFNASSANVSELVKSLFFVPFTKADGRLQPIVHVGWTLNYEMYFYILLAIGILFAKNRAPFFACAAIIGMSAVQSLEKGASAWSIFYGREITFEFILGVAAFYLTSRLSKEMSVGATRWVAAAVAISFLILASYQAFRPDFVHLFPRSISFGIPSLVIVGGAVLLARSGLDSKAAFWILLGDSSYVLYLTHQYVMYFQDRIIARRFSLLHLSSAPGMLVGVTTAVAVGIAAHLFVEKPALRYLYARFIPQPTLQPSLSLSMAIAGGEDVPLASTTTP